MSDMPIVDWNALKPQAAGSRTYKGPEVEAKAIWKCPVCSAENVTLLQDGCPSCGSGRPGKHVGVDPVITPEERARLLRGEPRPTQRAILTNIQDDQPPFDHLAFGDFLMWIDQLVTRPAPEKQASWMPVFLAGWHAGQRRGAHDMADHAGNNAPAPRMVEDPPIEGAGAAVRDEAAVPPEGAGGTAVADSLLKGTAEQRTILAALIYFRDQVLPEAQEEIGTGQWLDVPAVEHLIHDLQKDLA